MEVSKCAEKKLDQSSTEVVEKNFPSLINEMLPEEMLEQVFSHLAPKDLKTVTLVCTRWKNIAATSPALWTWVKFIHHDYFSLNSLLKMMGMERLRNVRHLRIENCPGSEQRWRRLLEGALKHPGLKTLRFPLYEPFAFPADTGLLTELLAKMEEVDSPTFSIPVLASVLQGANKLKKLRHEFVEGEDRSAIAKGLNKIEQLDLGEMWSSDVDLLLKEMQDQASSVTSLTLCSNWSGASFTSFPRAFEKLRELELRFYHEQNPTIGIFLAFFIFLGYLPGFFLFF